MSGSITIRRARLVLPKRVVTGDLLVVDGVIEAIGPELGRTEGEEIDAEGLTVLPGLVDALVALPLTQGDPAVLARESGASVAGGVTSMLVTDLAGGVRDEAHVEALMERAAREARNHVGFLATPDPERPQSLRDLSRAAGVHLPIGRWCGSGALGREVAEAAFAESPRLLVAEGVDPGPLEARRAMYADATSPREHSKTYPPSLAADLVAELVVSARKHGQRLHFGRISCPEELEHLLGVDAVTAQVTLPHLAMWAPDAYERLGSRAVTDPPLRPAASVEAMWTALLDGDLAAVGSGHVAVQAPDKDRPYPASATGLPTVGALLPLLLERVASGQLTMLQVAQWTSDAPARLIGLPRVGRLEVGFDADLVLVAAGDAHALQPSSRSWSGWSPFDGITARGRVVMTVLRGRPAYREGRLVDGIRGVPLTFSRS